MICDTGVYLGWQANHGSSDRDPLGGAFLAPPIMPTFHLALLVRGLFVAWPWPLSIRADAVRIECEKPARCRRSRRVAGRARALGGRSTWMARALAKRRFT